MKQVGGEEPPNERKIDDLVQRITTIRSGKCPTMIHSSPPDKDWIEAHPRIIIRRLPRQPIRFCFAPEFIIVGRAAYYQSIKAFNK